MIRLLMFGVLVYFTINFTLSHPDAAKRLKSGAELAAKSAAKYTIEGAHKLNKVLSENNP